MQKAFMVLVTAATIGSAALVAAPAQAQTAPVDKLVAAIRNGDVKADYVQNRRYYYRGGPRHVERRYYGPRGYYGPRRYGYYGDRYYYRRDRGNALAAGAIGLATGAIIGGAIAQSQAAPVYRGNAYCAQRYRSYDPASGTYLGHDGLRHPCP